MLSVLKKNLALKILSVLLAVILWAVVSRGRGAQDMEASVGIPVELHNLSPDMEVVTGPVERVDVRLKGPRSIVSKISTLGITIPLDLSGTTEGDTTFELFSSDVTVPPEVSVTRISPSTINLKLERIIRRRVAVEPVVSGKPPEGFHAGQPSVEPKSVEVRGPRSVISEVVSLKTAAVVLDGATDTVRRDVNIILPDGRMNLVNRYVVTVTVPVSSSGSVKKAGGLTIRSAKPKNNTSQ